MKKKALLFIVWDGPYVNYLEGLFLPILTDISDRFDLHIIQFSWNDDERRKRLQSMCTAAGINYTHRQVLTGRLSIIGKVVSSWTGAAFLRRYIRNHQIDIVMPRSTVPARMVLMVMRSYTRFELIFDADGLPIEERVDFAGLKKGSLRYRFLKRTEQRILSSATRVIVRARAAVEVLMEQHGDVVNADKFYVVSNGRDAKLFRPLDADERNRVRVQNSIPEEAFLMVFVGSLGPQYGVEEMFYMQRVMHARRPDSFLYLIVTNPTYLERHKAALPPNTIVKTLPFSEVSRVLGSADIGLAIRSQSFSMKGVAPIKLGEYFLSGLPVIASSGIGDTQHLLQGQNSVFLLNDHSQASLDLACEWLQSKNAGALSADARRLGEQYFSLETAVSSYLHALKGL